MCANAQKKKNSSKINQDVHEKLKQILSEARNAGHVVKAIIGDNRGNTITKEYYRLERSAVKAHYALHPRII